MFNFFICACVCNLWSSLKGMTHSRCLSCLSSRTVLEEEIGVNKEQRGLPVKIASLPWSSHKELDP